MDRPREEVTRIRARRETKSRNTEFVGKCKFTHEAEFDSIVASLPSRFEAKGKQVLLYTLNQNARIAHREQSRYQGEANQVQMVWAQTSCQGPCKPQDNL